MTAAVHKPRGGQPITFDPSTGEIHPARSTGISHTVDKTACLPLRWPSGSKNRYDLFDAWHDVAMQVVDRAGARFRLLAVAKKVIRWDSGTITLSNAELAARAGRCSEKTITRDVAQAADLGIFIVDMGWRKEGTQIVRTRTIRPAVPTVLPVEIAVPTGGFDLDTSCPDRSAGDLDTSCPGDLDTSCPITIDHKKGGTDAA